MDFFTVERKDAPSAHQWHCGFAAAAQSILPRTQSQFFEFIEEGYVWAAHDERGYAGLAYCYPDQQSDGRFDWELGGLMIAANEKGRGVASTLARLVLINTLVKENPFRRGDKVISHVLASNEEPRMLIQKALGFDLVARHEYPSDALPGLPTNARGMVEGDLFNLPKVALAAFADWCDLAPAHLKDGRPLHIRFGDGFGFPLYSAALKKMAQ
jgi:hypothetical protein